MTQLGLESINNTKLQQEWLPGANTYLGTTVSGYPNMFHIYGPHGPTLLSNGPTTVELQGRWIADAIDKMRLGDVKYVNPTREASDAWKKQIVDLNNGMLFPTTRSTYMGGVFPGRRTSRFVFRGIPEYAIQIRKALDGWEGFDVVKN